MANHVFLLTYSVSPANDDHREHQALAVSLRQKLNRVEIEDWVKLSSVETSFSGHMYLNETIVSKKRQEAQDIVWNQFKEVMDSLSAYRETIVSVALMVQGLGEHIEFTI